MATSTLDTMAKTATSTFTTTHARVEGAGDFASAAERLERQLGKFDPAAVRSLLSDPGRAADVRERIESMAGPSGFMIFATTEHGALLTAFGQATKAIQYVIGHPLLALEMARRDIGVGLYAPLRLLLHEKNGKAVLEYDVPSSLLGQFDDPAIAAVASTLDRKMEALVAAAAR